MKECPLCGETMRLTTREFRSSAVGPEGQLDVPLRRTCSRCGGRGETWQEWCEPCEGGGEVASSHELKLRVPAGVREGARFRFSVMPPGAPYTLVEVRVSIR